ncbi:hypothetical protein [Janthinobacterium sp. PSPC3-1]|uniref:hypothetical protein n=1 Tax=Janthinobacterium sp. PSPC3-1 TaxID=2804653 RepID=UPI003CF227F8
MKTYKKLFFCALCGIILGGAFGLAKSPKLIFAFSMMGLLVILFLYGIVFSVIFIIDKIVIKKINGLKEFTKCNDIIELSEMTDLGNQACRIDESGEISVDPQWLMRD